MDGDKQLEKQLEQELDDMPAQDLDDDDTYDEYDLIVIPDQAKTSPRKEAAAAKEEEEDEEEIQEVVDDDDDDDDEEEEDDEEDEEEAPQKVVPKLSLRRTWPDPAAGEDLTTIELISSDDEPSMEEEPSGNRSPSSSNSSDVVGVIEDSDSELSSDSDGPGGTNQLEQSYEDLLAQPNKHFAQLVAISEIAFKLNDLEKIEASVLTLQNLATVPAHIWLKYLKARLVVTQTPDERKEFEEKCAKALSFYYNIPLSEFIVNYLVDQGNVENHVLWAKLLADYHVERPDFGDKLSQVLSTITDEKEAAAFEEVLQKHCVSWKCSEEQRKFIKAIVDDYKRYLDDMKTQHSDWDWTKILKQHVAEAEVVFAEEDLKNAVIRFFFERTVSKFPIADILWLTYIEFVQGESGTAEEEEEEENAELAAKRLSRLGKGFLRCNPLELARRGVRSRPSVRLNHKYLDLMERADFEQTAVDEQIRTILQRIVPDMMMTVELHLDYLAYRVRNTNAGDEEQAASLRAAFTSVWEELSSLYGDKADTRYEVLQLWAQVEYTHLASPSNGSHIWRQIMGYPGSSQRGSLWLGYAQMESEYNAGQGTRDILREAISQPTLEDGILVMELFRRYERCYGTCETIAACQAMETPGDRARPRIKTKIQQVYPRQQVQPSQNREPLNREQRRRQAHEQQQPPLGKKRALPKPASRTESPNGSQPPSKARLAENPTAAEAKESNFKYSPNLEINKIFVRNLHPACTKEELHGLFSPFGNIKDVRLVHKQNKQFKGIAYVEFEKPGEAQRAVAGSDGKLLRGMNISVAISNPPPRGSTSDAPKPSVAPKRRVPTSLIPTTLVRQEVAAKKRRLEQVTLERDGDGDEPTTSSTPAAADESTEPEANGKPAIPVEEKKEEEEPAAAPKSNDDFRKLFLKD
ncbi:RNA-binding protein 4F [Drosophila subpulchrella]|uniref:RNA-binding protein 4F n=1 Tax=Drosophila subpulchrella TaxID=1486046 RepID=UPI0018A19F1A|nr:RNA-binding protein 4F [Drosophila subpulchrella]